MQTGLLFSWTPRLFICVCILSRSWFMPLLSKWPYILFSTKNSLTLSVYKYYKLNFRVLEKSCEGYCTQNKNHSFSAIIKAILEIHKSMIIWEINRQRITKYEWLSYIMWLLKTLLWLLTLIRLRYIFLHYWSCYHNQEGSCPYGQGSCFHEVVVIL